MSGALWLWVSLAFTANAIWRHRYRILAVWEAVEFELRDRTIEQRRRRRPPRSHVRLVRSEDGKVDAGVLIVVAVIIASLLLVLFATTGQAGGDPQRNPWPAQDRPLPCIRSIEQRADPDNYDYDRSGKYTTPYQFDQRTWDSNATAGPHTDWVGRIGEAPPDIVDSQARVLVSRRGLQPWPPAKGCRR